MPSPFNFRESIPPYFEYHGEQFYRIQGVDRHVTGSRHLFLATNKGMSKGFGVHGVFIDSNEWIATGTFRNSLYIEPLSQLTNIRDLRLLIDYEGALKLKLYCAAIGRPTQCLQEATFFSKARLRQLVDVGSPTHFPEGARLFWHIDGLPGGVSLYDMSFVTSALPRTDCRLMVLLRTYGRTPDLKAILKRFAEAGREDPFYGSILDNVNFWVLDTTTGAIPNYQELWQKDLNLRVWLSENLGGGGNAGHMLKLLEEACQAPETAPTELLILDDDLSLSPESLARYFMFCAYRNQDLICSVPVLMKSRPTVVWEDGGFWGRLNFHEGGSFNKKRNLFPNLLKHGKELDGFDGLDMFGPLNPCEYSTFIFFGLPMTIFRKLGYPAAFFLRGDDIEYSLRAQELGIQMFTNPNLAAWHEPAHSYAQEYMAIMHGIIINLTYGEHEADFYIRFFEGRLHEHASIDDLVGLSVYRDILGELVNPASPVLSLDFQTHYLRKLKEFGSVKMLRIPEADRLAFEKRAKKKDVLLVPFVYPGYRKDAREYRSIVVFNQSAKAYREIEPAPAREKAALFKSYLDLLIEFETRFTAIRDHWRERVAETSQESYWSAIREKYKSRTKEVFSAHRAPTKESKSKTPISEGEDEENVAANRTWLRKLREVFEANQRSNRARGSREDATKLAQARDRLPADFDPAVYLHINQDVKDAGMDPVDHYLKFGQAEGRKYKLTGEITG